MVLDEDTQAVSPEAPESEDQFFDVEQFLADYEPENEEAYEEFDTAEALAISWKERRQELTRLKNARRFDEAGKMKRQFRVEVEELKKRTRCHRCNQVGHWSRECPKPKGQGKGDAGNGILATRQVRLWLNTLLQWSSMINVPPASIC